ncbi:TonB-dependent receptor [Sunxiuqinia sp. sy24]|uniref:TonB-dependent receptor n=1 Tax=Sunxiuqinia sp. sy24 TaxID=3461495 RepID=UPI004045F481
MKLIVLLMTILISQTFAISSYSQDKLLSLRLTNSTVKDALIEIEKSSEFYFLYSNLLVDVDRKINVDLDNKKIEEVLTDIFQGTETVFVINDRQIILKPDSKNADWLGMQQKRKISGTITDSSGQPLPGVTVLVKGTTQGTVTDFDGNYSIDDVSVSGTLVFSFVGMRTQEVVVGNQSTINVTMDDDAIGLEEVVAVGYGTQKKVSLTGSVTQINSDELTVAPVGNAAIAIAGRMPGVITKQTSGMPGSDNVNISVRGFGTPLVLVDGIETSFNRIDPNEIESITVLKDAAAAIYGSRAGNGVVLVTTKRGKMGKPVIEFKNSYSLQRPVVNPNYVDAGSFAEMWREANLADGIDPLISVGGQLVPLTPEVVDNFKNGAPGYYNTDWAEVLFRDDAPMIENNLSVRGGSEKIKFFTSLGHFDQRSILASDDVSFKRYSARANIDAEIAESLTYTLDLAYRNEFRDRLALPVADIFNGLDFAQPIYPYVPGDEMASYHGNDQTSIDGFSERNISGFEEITNDIFSGNMSLKYDLSFIKGLSLKAKLSYLYNGQFNKRRGLKFDIYTLDGEGIPFVLHSRETDGGSLTEKFNKYIQIYPLISAEYDADIDENNKINAMLLAEQIDNRSVYFSGYRGQFLSKELNEFFAGSETGQNVSGGSSETARRSYAGRLNYSYKDKYLLSGTFRFDASSKFPSDSRWGFFPSVSAGWRISEEPFFNTDVVNNLKLRGSYSEAGVDNIDNAFQHLIGFNVQGGDPFLFGNNEAYARIRATGLPNPNATWENVTTYNLGVDVSLLNSKVVFEGNVFYREREGILANSTAQIPSTFGLSLPQENINSQNNRGYDATLTYQGETGKFRYTISGNLTFSRAKWDHYEEEEYTDPDQIRIYQRSGQWTNRIFGYLTDGFFNSQAEIEALPYDQDQHGNSTLKPGDIIYKDVNDDGEVDFRDQVELGYGSFPDMSYGLRLAGTYKNFSADMLWQGASRFNMSITSAARSPFLNNGVVPQKFYEKYRWTPDDPANPTKNINPDAELPGIHSNGLMGNNTKMSDLWLKDGTYLRLKSLSVSYKIPTRLIEGVLEGASVFVSGTNLLTLSKLGIYKDSFDPEFSGVGTTTLVFPNQRSITVGLNIVL